MKLSTHVNSGQVYRVYWNPATAAYFSLYFFSFLSLRFSNIKNFCQTFLRNCEAYKVDLIHTWPMGGCIVYTPIRLLPLICPRFPSLQFSNIKIFVGLFSETVRLIKLTLDIYVDNGWMYRVYCNQVAASYLSLISFSVLMFKNLKFSQEL